MPDVSDQVLLRRQSGGIDGVGKGETVNVAVAFYDGSI